MSNINPMMTASLKISPEKHKKDLPKFNYSKSSLYELVSAPDETSGRFILKKYVFGLTKQHPFIFNFLDLIN